MNIGFYYHIPAHRGRRGITLPSYIGIFIDGLASRVDNLYLIAHTDDTMGDYSIQNNNIILVDLGVKTSSLHRSFCYKNILSKIEPFIPHIDKFLVRAPSPLAASFNSFNLAGKPVLYYIVGDYSEVARSMRLKSIADFFRWCYLTWCHLQLMNVIEGKRVLVNSPALMKWVQPIAGVVDLLPSTTLRNVDFSDIVYNDFLTPIKILYTGRLDLSKGLVELINATGLLLKDLAVELHLVGWEDNLNHPVETILRKRVSELDIDKHVIFHGKKKIGKELNEIYRMADIYCIPSYNEGFPRTIWEAMANGLPVIASRVGGIPYYLKHEVDALLIEPKSVDAIVKSVHKIITNKALRINLCKNGMNKALLNTIDKRSDELICFLYEAI